MKDRIVRPSGFDSGPILGPSLRTSPGDVLSTARSAVSKPAAVKGTTCRRRVMKDRAAFMNNAWLAPSVIDAVDGDLLGAVVLVLERIDRTRLGIDERSHLLRLFVGETPRVEVRHRVADDSGERVDARRARSIVPRIRSPQWPGPLVADDHTLPIGAMTGRASLHEQ